MNNFLSSQYYLTKRMKFLNWKISLYSNCIIIIIILCPVSWHWLYGSFFSFFSLSTWNQAVRLSMTFIICLPLLLDPTILPVVTRFSKPFLIICPKNCDWSLVWGIFWSWHDVTHPHLSPCQQMYWKQTAAVKSSKWTEQVPKDKKRMFTISTPILLVQWNCNEKYRVYLMN